MMKTVQGSKYVFFNIYLFLSQYIWIFVLVVDLRIKKNLPTQTKQINNVSVN